MPDNQASLHTRLEIRLNELPVLPTVIARLLDLDPEKESYLDDLRALVEMEPNYAARLLAAANSAASAPAEPITSLRLAIARLGSRGAADLVLAISVARVFVPRDAWERSLWVHALQVGHASREFARLARASDISPDDAYVCGLLHDVGRFIMFQELPAELRRIDEGDWNSPERLVDMERSVCGLTHSELGAAACRKWGLPGLVESVVRDHHAPMPEASEDRPARLTALVRLADIAMFPSAMPGTRSLLDADEATLQADLLPRLPSFLKLSARDLHTAIRAATYDSAQVTQSLGFRG